MLIIPKSGKLQLGKSQRLTQRNDNEYQNQIEPRAAFDLMPSHVHFLPS
jgi:hypothetical protein